MPALTHTHTCFVQCYLQPQPCILSPYHPQHTVIDDAAEDLISPPILVKRVALCSGQMYFRAQEERKARGRWDVALVRVEQLAPFPFQQVKDTLERYSNAEIVWLQEEPKNMGAWSHVRPRAKTVLGELQFSQKIRYIGRNPSASPATGLAVCVTPHPPPPYSLPPPPCAAHMRRSPQVLPQSKSQVAPITSTHRASTPRSISRSWTSSSRSKHE